MGSKRFLHLDLLSGVTGTSRARLHPPTMPKLDFCINELIRPKV